jgi:hypothetical protein
MLSMTAITKSIFTLIGFIELKPVHKSANHTYKVSTIFLFRSFVIPRNEESIEILRHAQHDSNNKRYFTLIGFIELKPVHKSANHTCKVSNNLFVSFFCHSEERGIYRDSSLY